MKNISSFLLSRPLALAACGIWLAAGSPGRAPGAESGPTPLSSPKPAPGRIKLSDLFGDDVVARGTGVEVRRSLLDQTFTAYRASMAARGQTVPEEKRVGSEAQLLQRLVVTQALTNRVTPADLPIALEAAQRKLKESLDQAGSPEAFARQLKAAGLNEEV